MAASLTLVLTAGRDLIAFERTAARADRFAFRFGPAELVNYIAEYGKTNVTEAMRIGGKRWHTAKSRLMKLVDRNMLDHVDSKAIERDKDACFTLKKKFSDKLRS